ncbi:Uncharacterised protein [Mycobacteroides abscessus subsp. abscessus]|nr:Uncharacterised protein [Mycobacteroides abscessus subsp. abscessus]
MSPRTLPKGSITEAVTNSSPRGVTGECTEAPRETRSSSVASTSSTCQYVTELLPGAVPSGAKTRLMMPSSSSSGPMRNSM